MTEIEAFRWLDIETGAYEGKMDPDVFEQRMEARRMDRMDGRVRRRLWNGIVLIVGGALAFYVVQAIVWGVM